MKITEEIENNLEMEEDTKATVLKLCVKARGCLHLKGELHHEMVL